ncbi:MAG TPA: tetratricopeptide repeat protein [Candidatus Obscuribacterales bacterium]|nr:tetratricopeptide repeat protein [Candidatus Obscuribacterales bacterium]
MVQLNLESLRTKQNYDHFNQPRERRGKGRLVFVFFAAVGLVTLPVLPLTFLGDGGLPKIDEWQQKIFGIINKAPSTARGGVITASQNVGEKRDQVKLLDGAARELLKALESDQDNPALHNQLGLIYAESGDFETAISHFRRVVAVAREKIAEKSVEAQKLRQTGDVKGATAAVLACSKVNVELSAAHGNLARMFESLGQHDKVVAQLEELKHDISVGADLNKPTASARMAAPGAALGQSGTRMSPETLLSLARAQALMQSRRVPEAVNEYNAIVQKEPGIAIAHQQLGLVAAHSGDLTLAEKELKEAIRLDEKDVVSHTSLAMTYSSLGDTGKAKQEFEKALLLEPRNLEAAGHLSSMLSTHGDHDAALAVLERAVKHHPNNAILRNNLGTMHSQKGEYHAAILNFQKALSVAPDMPSAHYGLGLAYYNLRDYMHSIGEFKRALQLDPSLIDAHNKIESAYRHIGLASSGRSG